MQNISLKNINLFLPKKKSSQKLKPNKDLIIFYYGQEMLLKDSSHPILQEHTKRIMLTS